MVCFPVTIRGGGCGCKNTLDTHVESFCDVSGDCNEVGDYTTNFTAINEEQMIVSPVMIPNKPIIRKDDNGDDFYVYFTPDTIERMAHNFLKKKFVDNMNIEHSSFMKLGGINVVESWLKKSNEDKSSKYGYGDLPEGTWFPSHDRKGSILKLPSNDNPFTAPDLISCHKLSSSTFICTNHVPSGKSP